MFPFNYYVPILRGKSGEFRALECLKKKTKNKLTPMIDIPKVPLKYPQKTPKLSLEDHLDKVSKNIRKAWGIEKPIFVDLFDIDLSARTSSGEHYLKMLAKCLQVEGIKPIYTTGLDRDDDYNKELAEIISENPSDICVRLQEEDLDAFDVSLDELNDLLDMLNVTHEDTHLLLDYRGISEGAIKNILQKTAMFINEDDNILRWKSFIVAGTGYPESLSGIKPDTISTIERTEFIIWDYLYKNAKKIKRVPSFGDYGVVNPVGPEFDPTIMSASAKIRYTVEDEWLLLKGHSLKRPPKFK